MKTKKLNYLLVIPIIGSLSIYIYVCLVMLTNHTTDIYLLNPKSNNVSVLYNNLFYYLPFVGHCSIVVGLFLILSEIYIFKEKLTNNWAKWVFLLGILITVISITFDFGHYLSWFSIDRFSKMAHSMVKSNNI